MLWPFTHGERVSGAALSVALKRKFPVFLWNRKSVSTLCYIYSDLIASLKKP
jgi:hypothetical protein